MSLTNLGFLASHRGSNMQSVIDACNAGRVNANPVVVISNNRKSFALKRARKEGIAAYNLCGLTHPDSDVLDETILATLQEHRTGLVILAGFLRKIGPKTLAAYRNRIINIHPALLPKYGGQGMYGKNVHRAVVAAGDKETGVTIHIVDKEYDTGPILAQKTMPVAPDDTPESLAERLIEVEHRFLVETIQRIIIGEIILP